MTIRFVMLVCAAAVALPEPAWAGDSGWIRISGVRYHTDRLKRENELPVTIECRNDSKVAAAWKPAVRIISKPNTANKEWNVLAAIDNRTWNVGNPITRKDYGWRVVSRKVVKGGGGGTMLQCIIWHRPAQ